MQNENYVIEVFPIGPINRGIIHFIKEVIERTFRMPTSIGSTLDIPREAFNVARKQYNASMILDMLERQKSDRALKAIGVIDEDLYAKGLTYVFGQAKLGGCCGVVSLARLYAAEDNFDGRALFYRRIEKEIIHELGHTYGLRHCPNPECVMYYSRSIADTDRKSSNFCVTCGAPVMYA